MRVLVVGLDCAEPSLVFDRWRDELPTLRRLMDGIRAKKAPAQQAGKEEKEGK